MKRDRILFLLKFVGLVAVLYAVIAINPVNDRVIVPFTQFITLIAGKMLMVGGQAVSIDRTLLSSPGFAVNVENGCNGIEATIILVAAVAAFPATWAQRLLGILVGFLAVQAANIVRVAMLFWLGVHHRGVFDLFHVAIWQSVIVLFSVAIFMVWSWKFARKPLANSR